MTLSEWIAGEVAVAARAMLRSVSATEIVKCRPGFGQTIVPKPGSIVASPELAAYDPDPDYFFHWIRDSAIVIDAVRLLLEDGVLGVEAVGLFRDFLRFNLDLCALRGATVGDPRRGVAPDFLRFVRDRDDLATLEGPRLLGEPRFNPDGTLDISRWSRPQTDGPALRALAVLRWRATDPAIQAMAADLVCRDLDFTAASWRAPSIDIWEEDLGHHHYTRLVQEAALRGGAAWAAGRGLTDRATLWATEAAAIERTLDDFRGPAGDIVGRRGVVDGRARKDPDVATILAVLHADRSGPHGIDDPAVLATLDHLSDWCAAAYPINRDRPAGVAPALGRYPGDQYYGGNVFVLGTLAAAELQYRRAAAGRSQALALGDAYVAAVRRFTPESGALPEQFDRTTGAATSAKNLAWSYAAFIGAAHWRRRAVSAAT